MTPGTLSALSDMLSSRRFPSVVAAVTDNAAPTVVVTIGAATPTVEVTADRPAVAVIGGAEGGEGEAAKLTTAEYPVNVRVAARRVTDRELDNAASIALSDYVSS